MFKTCFKNCGTCEWKIRKFLKTVCRCQRHLKNVSEKESKKIWMNHVDQSMTYKNFCGKMWWKFYKKYLVSMHWRLQFFMIFMSTLKPGPDPTYKNTQEIIFFSGFISRFLKLLASIYDWVHIENTSEDALRKCIS
jgi:hypothetical protein